MSLFAAVMMLIASTTVLQNANKKRLAAHLRSGTKWSGKQYISMGPIINFFDVRSQSRHKHQSLFLHLAIGFVKEDFHERIDNINPNENTNLLTEFVYQGLNGALPSRKCIIKAPAKSIISLLCLDRDHPSMKQTIGAPFTSFLVLS